MGTKISALTAAASVAATDLLAIVADPSGTPTTKKATLTVLATLLRSLSETLTNKTISGASNTISDLAASAIASGQLATARGGTGVDSSASTGVWKVTAGTWATITLASGVETWLTTPSGANLAAALTSALTTAKGGTGQDFSGSTGFVKVTAGTMSAASIAASDIASGTLVHERGGLEADVSAYDGLVKISGGSTSAVTLPLSAANGGTGQDSSGWTGLASVSSGTWSALSLGSNVATMLGTFSSANIKSACTDETGSGGALVFATGPTIDGPTISGSPVISATDVSATGNARCKAYSNIANVQTTDATVTSLFTWTVTDEAVTMVTAEVLAVKSDGSTTAAYVVRARIKRDGGTVTVGSVEATYESEDSLNGAVTIDNSGATGRIRVTGIGATTIDWGCVVTRIEVTHA